MCGSRPEVERRCRLSAAAAERQRVALQRGVVPRPAGGEETRGDAATRTAAEPRRRHVPRAGERVVHRRLLPLLLVGGATACGADVASRSSATSPSPSGRWRHRVRRGGSESFIGDFSLLLVGGATACGVDVASRSSATSPSPSGRGRHRVQRRWHVPRTGERVVMFVHQRLLPLLVGGATVCGVDVASRSSATSLALLIGGATGGQSARRARSEDEDVSLRVKCSEDSEPS